MTRRLLALAAVLALTGCGVSTHGVADSAATHGVADGASTPDVADSAATTAAPRSAATDAAGQAGGAGEAESAAQQAAADAYARWVRGQIAQEAVATWALTSAVRRGDLAAARAAYPAARVNYERIEPVAEAFGELDASLDARVADVTSTARWTGYHRLERALFQDRDLHGMDRIAVLLEADVTQLGTLARHVSFTAPDLARGAGELLNEIGKTKITGEEEAYSHLDLVDFQANLDGSQQAFDLLAPLLQARDAGLVATVRTRFRAVHDRLALHRTGAAPTAFVSYTTVPPAERRTLSDLVDALAEPLSQTGRLLVIG